MLSYHNCYGRNFSKFWMKMNLENFAIFLTLFLFCEAEICIPRSYSYESIVCVCNSTYCDTIPKISVPLPGNYRIFTSSSDGLRFKKTEGEFSSCNVVTNSTYRINKNTTYQEIFGFGGSFTDSSGINILSLSMPAQDFLLKSYFSSEGIEYTMGRVPIGGTDFSTHGYTYQDNDTDINLGSFNLTIEDFEYKIPLIQRAQSMSTKPLKLVASCWSPPIWMKTSRMLTGNGLLHKEYYRAYANYHIKFLNEYKSKDVEFWCVTTGNEPADGYIIRNPLNAVAWTPINQTLWIKEDFGPILRKYYPNTCILAVDDQRFFYPYWLDWIMRDEEASKYINGTAVHWYLDFLVSSSVLTDTHEMYPDVFILNTESCYTTLDTDIVALGAWSRGEAYARDIIDSINHWVTGWIDWNLALDEEGGPNWVNNFVDAPIIVNRTADEFYKQPIFYVLGHFSKFITPGSVRLNGISSPFSDVQTLAVERPDNSTAVIFLNDKSYDVILTFIDDARGSIQLHLPKHSINSLIYK